MLNLISAGSNLLGLPEKINETFEDATGPEIAFVLIITALVLVLFIAVMIGILWVAMKINRGIFRRLEKKKGNSITLQFLEKAISLALIVVFVVIPLAGDRITQSLLGSTAVIGAVVGLAANDVIKDMFAGLEISIYKPFDVQSRVMLEDGRTGIVEKLTLRHIVLKMIDTTRIIVPNSKVNSMAIVNYSYLDEVQRSMEVKYPISYNSDIDLAKKVIRKTICENALTLNEDKYDESDPNSRTVYFLDLADSSIIIGATVYYSHDYRTEVVKDEINTRVFKALAENGIEIPYNYVNLVVRDK